MQFISADCDRELNIVRYLSDNQTWRLGVRSMLYGFRVSAYREGEGWYSIDYCCGNDNGLLLLTLTMVAKILESYDDSVSSDFIFQLFPRGKHKPIDSDPVFAELQKMAGVAPDPYWICSVPGCQRANYHDREKCDYCKCDRAETLVVS